MDIRDTITQCADTTRAKGFDVSQHATQLLLIASEVAEALELVTFKVPTEEHEGYAYEFTQRLMDVTGEIEAIRADAECWHDGSKASADLLYMEELADIVIRVFSYVGGNGWTDAFIQALGDKMEANKNRPHKHGKGF